MPPRPSIADACRGAAVFTVKNACENSKTSNWQPLAVKYEVSSARDSFQFLPEINEYVVCVEEDIFQAIDCFRGI
jgi:hypothetical protein